MRLPIALLAVVCAACDAVGPAADHPVPTPLDLPPVAASASDCGVTREHVFVDVRATVRTAGPGAYVVEIACPGDLVLAVTGPFLPAHNLPADLRFDGLAVVLSGERVEVPPGVRLRAQPLRLTAVRRA